MASVTDQYMIGQAERSDRSKYVHPLCMKVDQIKQYEDVRSNNSLCSTSKKKCPVSEYNNLRIMSKKMKLLSGKH
jgi:hypothetical protein